MTARRKILLFEINEVPFKVIDRYVVARPDSNLARMLGLSKQYRTICEDQVELVPWISWPTLHRGVIDQQHGIRHLGQALESANRSYPPVWQTMVEHGLTVGIMGSLHTSDAPEDLSGYAFYVPDFFADTAFAHPAQLRPFQAFNLAMTRRSTRNVDSGFALPQLLAFGAGYLRQGMSLRTARTAASALLAERRKAHLKCRRRSVQPLIALDLFLHHLEKSKPDFATLHANHVAAAMHRYWAAAFPEDAPNYMPAEWREKYSRELQHAMDVFDDMLEPLLAFVRKNPSYTLVVASSLGQEAVKAERTPGYISIGKLERFMEKLGLDRSKWSERFAMAPCVSVLVDDDVADAFEQRLQSLSIAGSSMSASRREIPPLCFDRTGSSFQLYVYFENFKGAWVGSVGGSAVTFEELGLAFHPHQDEIACSGRHIPEGMMLVYDPRQAAVDTGRHSISTLDIAPALLHYFDITPPNYMHEPDASLFDVSTAGVRVRLNVTGGGIETCVTRNALGTAQVGQAQA
jgi:hypothetical protein